MALDRPGAGARAVASRPGESITYAGSSSRNEDFTVSDGDAIVFTAGTLERCELIRRSGDRETSLRSSARGLGACPFLRCGDGGRCVLVTARDDAYVFQRFDLAAGEPRGPERRRAQRVRNLTLDLSPDGTTIAWALEDETATPALALLEIDTDSYREVRIAGTFRPHDVSWEGNDRWIVTGRDADSQVVVRMTKDGTYETLIREPRQIRFHNAFTSPDRRMLALVVEQGRTDVFAVDVGTAAP